MTDDSGNRDQMVELLMEAREHYTAAIGLFGRELWHEYVDELDKANGCQSAVIRLLAHARL